MQTSIFPLQKLLVRRQTACSDKGSSCGIWNNQKSCLLPTPGPVSGDPLPSCQHGKATSVLVWEASVWAAACFSNLIPTTLVAGHVLVQGATLSQPCPTSHQLRIDLWSVLSNFYTYVANDSRAKARCVGGRQTQNHQKNPKEYLRLQEFSSHVEAWPGEPVLGSALWQLHQSRKPQPTAGTRPSATIWPHPDHCTYNHHLEPPCCCRRKLKKKKSKMNYRHCRRCLPGICLLGIKDWHRLSPAGMGESHLTVRIIYCSFNKRSEELFRVLFLLKRMEGGSNSVLLHAIPILVDVFCLDRWQTLVKCFLWDHTDGKNNFDRKTVN